MSGWYLMHRGWMDNPVFRNEPYGRRDAFVWLIENAAHKPTRITTPKGEIELDRGQLSYSLRYIAKAWRWDEAKVRRYFISLEKCKIIDAETDAGQTKITICNYGRYQAFAKAADAANDAEATQDRRRSDANKKELKELKEKEEGGAADAASTGYAFSGRTIRLRKKDFDQWANTFHGVPDLGAELISLDAWFDGQDESKRKGWFHTVAGALNRKHQETLASRQAAAIGSQWEAPC